MLAITIMIYFIFGPSGNIIIYLVIGNIIFPISLGFCAIVTNLLLSPWAVDLFIECCISGLIFKTEVIFTIIIYESALPALLLKSTELSV